MKQGEHALDLEALFSLSYGLYVVGSCWERRLNAQISNTVFQVTDEPPRIAVSISHQELTHQYIAQSRVFAVSVLDESTSLGLIRLLGFRSGRDVDKLREVPFRTGTTGCPLITAHALSVLEVEVTQEVNLATHTVFIGEVVSGEVLREGTPLTYASYRAQKGRTPKNAPTYRLEHRAIGPELKGRRTISMQKYICTVCGYIYDPAEGDPDGGIEPGTAFEALPADWVCPVCQAGKDEFKKHEG